MPKPSVFESEVVLPDDDLSDREKTLLGFDLHYAHVRDHLRLLLNGGELDSWNRHHFAGRLSVCNLVGDQNPLIIYYGDVGTGKTVTAECAANRLARESGVEDSMLFKLGNRVRGAGRVGEMGTLLVDAFEQVVKSAGQHRRAVLIIDEGDSLAADRAQNESHHEDKVAVNTLIQCIDGLRPLHGRVVVFLCTNRVAALDPALRRRAAVVEEFTRPSDNERRQLFAIDLEAMDITPAQIDRLVEATSAHGVRPPFSYSDIRTRLYPAALARAFPTRPLCFDDLYLTARATQPSPAIEST